jgi:hypothetical protein
MLKGTSGKFTLILSLLEILFPNLCLFLFINVYIINVFLFPNLCLFLFISVFVGSLGLFWTKACVGESLVSFLS